MFLVLNSFYNTKSVVMCLGITVAVCLVVTIFSFQTKVRIFFSDVSDALYAWLNHSCVPVCHIVINIFRFHVMCFLHPDWRDIIPRRTLYLLHGHGHLWTGAGICTSLSICKYNYVIRAITAVTCNVNLTTTNSYNKYTFYLTVWQVFDMRLT